MNKQEYTAMGLPYGLKAMIRTENQYIHNVDHYMYQYICDSEKDESLYKYDLILLPLSDLTKPIEHNGEKFVPIYRLFSPIIDERNCAFTNEQKSYRLHVPIAGEVIKYNVNKDYNVNQFWVVQKLIEWHFNLMDESEPFIDVNSLETNPYK